MNVWLTDPIARCWRRSGPARCDGNLSPSPAGYRDFITFLAHIDGCLYHGQTSLDFVEYFVDTGAKVAVPTTLNVGSLDLIHPELYHGDRTIQRDAQRLMDAHLQLGCESSFTCAPYQLKHRPAKGEQIAWAESNAIVFANSVLGARTSRYGDFLDLAAAITGRAPYAGLHVEANRAARIVFNAPDFSRLPSRDIHFAALGLAVGKIAGAVVPAIVGLPADTDRRRTQGAGRGRRIERGRRAVPCGRRDARGADARRRIARPRGATHGRCLDGRSRRRFAAR